MRVSEGHHPVPPLSNLLDSYHGNQPVCLANSSEVRRRRCLPFLEHAARLSIAAVKRLEDDAGGSESLPVYHEAVDSVRVEHRFLFCNTRLCREYLICPRSDADTLQEDMIVLCQERRDSNMLATFTMDTQGCNLATSMAS